MDRHEKLIAVLERIATALEKQSGNDVHRRRETPTKPASKSAAPKGIKELLAVYCRSYKSRYGSYPIVTGKDTGIVKRLLSCMSLERATQIVQAYLQTTDEWFKKRHHDLSTLESNLSKVAVMLAQGSENVHDKNFWENIFDRETHGTESLSITDGKTNIDLRGTELPEGTTQDVLDCFSGN